MKTRWIQLISGCTMFVLCISVCTTTANATVIWEDNFDNPDLPGWTFFGYENDTSPVEIGGNFSAASGMLTGLDDDMNVARHNSTTNVGIWSFDMFVPDVSVRYGFFYVDFMSNGVVNNELGNLSVLCVGASFEDSRFWLEEGIGSNYHNLRSYTPDVFQGWYHIEVSRNSTGHLNVWFNGTLRMDIVDMSITSSTYFQVVSYNVTGAAIDNLVVDDGIHTTTTEDTLPWDLIAIGAGVAVAVIVLVIVYLRRR